MDASADVGQRPGSATVACSVPGGATRHAALLTPCSWLEYRTDCALPSGIRITGRDSHRRRGNGDPASGRIIRTHGQGGDPGIWCACMPMCSALVPRKPPAHLSTPAPFASAGTSILMLLLISQTPSTRRCLLAQTLLQRRQLPMTHQHRGASICAVCSPWHRPR